MTVRSIQVRLILHYWEKFGDVDGYFEHIGVSEEAKHKIRNKLLNKNATKEIISSVEITEN